MSDPSTYVVPGKTLTQLLDYSDDDGEYGWGSGGSRRTKGAPHSRGGENWGKDAMEMRDTKHGGPAIVLGGGTNAQEASTSLRKLQPAQHKNTNRKVMDRIHLDDFQLGSGGGSSGAVKSNNRVVSDVCEATLRKRASKRAEPKEIDRSERATVENVMDPRTRLLLYKLVNSNTLQEIHGCVSTGKEANVYYALSGDGSPSAVKVYKTSILGFKKRDQYVQGEFRFQRYCKSNPRKMVCTWAEKEARNLMRLQEGGVLAPAVKLLRQHILIMEFLGENGWPAPRLKDVQFPSFNALDQCYLDLCVTVRRMYNRCHLIHGDLSEYNLLLFRGRVMVIDVSQSVEHDHQLAMDFLRRDLVNLTKFFRSRGHGELFKLSCLFQFVTDRELPPLSSGAANLTDAEVHDVAAGRGKGPLSRALAAGRGADIGYGDDTGSLIQYLRDWREKQRHEVITENADQASVDEQVFLHIHVPQGLAEFSDVKAPNAEMTGFVDRMITKKEGAVMERSADFSSEDDSEESEEESVRHIDPQVRVAELSKEERKKHKKAVKEAQRMRRVEKKAQKEKGGKKKK